MKTGTIKSKEILCLIDLLGLLKCRRFADYVRAICSPQICESVAIEIINTTFDRKYSLTLIFDMDPPGFIPGYSRTF
jgi:hypothetical protein